MTFDEVRNRWCSLRKRQKLAVVMALGALVGSLLALATYAALRQQDGGPSADAMLVPPPGASTSASVAAQAPIQLKQAVFTGVDGSEVRLTQLHTDGIAVTAKRSIRFDRVARLDIEQPWDGTVVVTFADGERQALSKIDDQLMSGYNSDQVGHSTFLSSLRRLELQH